MKKCFVRVIHMVSITELMHIACLSRSFFFVVSVKVYVDLRTFREGARHLTLPRRRGSHA